jgi:hypothetical protein
MRIPVRSEGDAFRLTFGVVALIALAVALSVLLAPLAGVALVAGAVLGVIVWEFVTEDPERARPLREAAEAARRGRAADERRRILVIANETVGGRELRDELAAHGEDAELRVVCPILPTRAHLLTSDIDRELAEARDRLDRTLAWAAEQNLRMTGRVSEETPLAAACDELRAFPADEVIVSTHPPARSRWLESGLVDRLRQDLEIPVRHVVVDLTRQQVEARSR